MVTVLLVQRLVELVRAARRYKSPEIKKLNARLDRLVEMAYAAHRAKLQVIYPLILLLTAVAFGTL